MVALEIESMDVKKKRGRRGFLHVRAGERRMVEKPFSRWPRKSIGGIRKTCGALPPVRFGPEGGEWGKSPSAGFCSDRIG